MCAFVLLCPALAAGQDRALRVAVIGDFGDASRDGARKVAGLVRALNSEMIITTGDNNYPRGETKTIDRNIGQFYHDFIGKYQGEYGPGASENRFFPALGNHDWGNKSDNPKGCDPYLNWFSLPGNERYYEFVRGPVRFFALDSDRNEPDGVKSDSEQASWLRKRLSASREPWNVVYFHHPPYSSGSRHGPCKWMRWPFAEWGADLVLSGHEHSYERLSIGGGSDGRTIPYVISGASGAKLSKFVSAKKTDSRSEARISEQGVVLLTATPEELTVEFFAADTGIGKALDATTLVAAP